MKAFLVSVAIFISLLIVLAGTAFLILIDTSPMGKMEYLLRVGRFAVFSYTGIGRLNEADIKSIYESRCTRKCHSRDVIERSSHTAREWEDIIAKMKTVNDARVTDSESGVILSYLSRHYGSNIPTILTPEGSKFLKKYLWRSDFGESDLYVDIIYTPVEYFNWIGGNKEVEGYRAEDYVLFKVYLNTHQEKLAPFALERLAVLKAENGRAYDPIMWKVTYESSDKHHREGILVFRKIESGGSSMTLSLNDLPGRKERLFIWELPVPEKL